jgi:hypothetical protein
MRKFPHQFSDMLTPGGLSILKGEAKNSCSLFLDPERYFATFGAAVDTSMAEDCVRIMDAHLYEHLAVEQRRIPPESITKMRRNYQEVLSKTMHIKTAFFRRRNSRACQAAERIGLLRMMRSSTFTDFAEAVTGLKLDRNLDLQVSCYEHGDYVGPHNDHHPETETLRHGYVDFHVMFTNNAVSHQYLVYEEGAHFSKIVNVNIQGGVSIYKLPFWHYTTPLAGKSGQERDARRWLLLGTFQILSGGHHPSRQAASQINRAG